MTTPAPSASGAYPHLLSPTTIGGNDVTGAIRATASAIAFTWRSRT